MHFFRGCDAPFSGLPGRRAGTQESQHSPTLLSIPTLEAFLSRHYTGVFDISVHICEHTLRRVCTCARVCAVCSITLGDEVGGFIHLGLLSSHKGPSGVGHYFLT